MTEPRIRLSSIEPRGPRNIRLRTLLVVAWAGALLSIVGVLLPWHSYEGQAHLALQHGGAVAFGPPGLVVIFTAVVWNRMRFWWLLGWVGVLVLGVVGSLVALLVVELSHLFDDTPELIGLTIYMVGTLAQLTVAAVAFAAVPIEFFRARREREVSAAGGLPRAELR